MPYPKDHKAKSKDRILQSATDLFCRYGFDKVSINEVMKLAKMTPGAFYAHFESKEALYKASFREALQRSKATRLMKGPFSIQHLSELVTGYLNLGNFSKTPSPSPEAFLANDIASDNIEIKKLYEQSYLGLIKLLETRLTALNKLKNSTLSLSPASIPDRARVILASMIGAIAISKSITQEDEKEAILAATQEQIFGLLNINSGNEELSS
jgi:AcrR family transcriptional regulator